MLLHHFFLNRLVALKRADCWCCHLLEDVLKVATFCANARLKPLPGRKHSLVECVLR